MLHVVDDRNFGSPRTSAPGTRISDIRIDSIRLLPKTLEKIQQKQQTNTTSGAFV